MTTPAVVRRGGEPDPDFSVLQGLVDPERIESFRRCIIPMPLIEISSSELRQRVAQGRSIRFRTPRAVEAFIGAEELYRPIFESGSRAVTRWESVRGNLSSGTLLKAAAVSLTRWVL